MSRSKDDTTISREPNVQQSIDKEGFDSCGDRNESSLCLEQYRRYVSEFTRNGDDQFAVNIALYISYHSNSIAIPRAPNRPVFEFHDEVLQTSRGNGNDSHHNLRPRESRTQTADDNNGNSKSIIDSCKALSSSDEESVRDHVSRKSSSRQRQQRLKPTTRFPDQLYALVLQFEANDAFESIRPVSLPVLRSPHYSSEFSQTHQDMSTPSQLVPEVRRDDEAKVGCFIIALIMKTSMS